MATLVQPWYLDHLACPDCGRHMEAPGTAGVACSCGFARAAGSPLDLRPIAPVARQLMVPVTSTASRDLANCLVERPVNSYSGPHGMRDASELFSAAASSILPGASLLDLGCGPRDQAAVAAHLGLRYVGVDYTSAKADILADAHALPFDDGAFDLVLSYAVLEHLYNPFLATHEVHRVLKPGGMFFGTVSLGEPFHDSYFHHTAWGVLHVLNDAGLKVTRLWHSHDTLRALATMGRYPRAGRWLLRLADRLMGSTSILAPRKHFSWSRREKDIDALHRAASICFVAVKAA